MFLGFLYSNDAVSGDCLRFTMGAKSTHMQYSDCSISKFQVFFILQYNGFAACSILLWLTWTWSAQTSLIFMTLLNFMYFWDFNTTRVLLQWCIFDFIYIGTQRPYMRIMITALPNFMNFWDFNTNRLLYAVTLMVWERGFIVTKHLYGRYSYRIIT